jgi:hypothetical protein
MADEEVVKITVDVSDAEAAFERMGKAGEAAAQHIKDSFDKAKPSEDTEQHAHNLGHAFEEMAEKGGAAIKQLGARFGEGGSLIAEFAEKIMAAIGKIPAAFTNAGTAFGKFGETAKAAGGGMSGFAAAAGGVAEALGPIALASGATVAGMTALVYAAGALASKLSDVREQIQGTEADFARLEIAGRNTSLGTEAMAQATVAIRDGFRRAAVELQNYGEMMQVTQERQKEAAEQQELLAAKRAARGDPVAMAAVQEREDQLAEARSATRAHRMTAAVDRMRRQFQESMSGIARIFGGQEMLESADPEKIMRIGEALEGLSRSKNNIDALKNEMKALADQVVEAQNKGGPALANMQRGLDETVGPHASRLLQDNAREWQRTAHLSDEAAEEMNRAMGGLSEAERKNLDQINQDMKRTIHSFEELAIKAGSALSPIITILGDMAEALVGIPGLIDKISSSLDKWSEKLPVIGGYLKSINEWIKKNQEDYAKQQAATEHAKGGEVGKEGFRRWEDVEAERRKSIEQSKGFRRLEDVQEEQRRDWEASKKKQAEQEAPKGGSMASAVAAALTTSSPIGAIGSGLAMLFEMLTKQGDSAKEAAPKVDKLGENSDKTADSVKALGEAADAASKTPATAGEHQSGGYISGPGTGTSDSILARLSNGEFVMSARSVAHYGTTFMHMLNARRFAEGGLANACERPDEDTEFKKMGFTRSTVTGRWYKDEGTRRKYLTDDEEHDIWSKLQDEAAKRCREAREKERQEQVKEAFEREKARPDYEMRYAFGGLVDSFADAFQLSLPKFAGGGAVSSAPAAPLHPLYLSFNGGGYVGGLTATPSAVEQIGRHAVLAQASSTMRSKPSWVR